MSDIARQLVEQVDTARVESRQLNIVGGGSKAFLGREASGEPVDMAAHRGIVDYEPVELVLTARAGTPIADIVAVLDEHDQMLSFEPPEFDGQASIGGTLACNISGPGRPWGGAVRDMVLGIRLINGRAEHLRFGGQVMKNVAGYDVSRLQAGAMGTLGIITEVSLKVLPRPAKTLTLVREVDAAEAILTMNQLSGQARPLTGACWLDGKLYLRLAGAGSAVESTATQWSGDIVEDGGEFWRGLREQQLSFFSGPSPLWRFSLKASAAHFLAEANWLIDWGGAQRWLRAGDARPEGFDKTALEQAAVAGGGQVGLFRGGDRRGEVFHSQSEALRAIHKRLKSAFDPHRLFNPGRLYSWL